MQTRAPFVNPLLCCSASWPPCARLRPRFLRWAPPAVATARHVASPGSHAGPRTTRDMEALADASRPTMGPRPPNRPCRVTSASSDSRTAVWHVAASFPASTGAGALSRGSRPTTGRKSSLGAPVSPHLGPCTRRGVAVSAAQRSCRVVSLVRVARQTIDSTDAAVANCRSHAGETVQRRVISLAMRIPRTRPRMSDTVAGRNVRPRRAASSRIRGRRRSCVCPCRGSRTFAGGRPPTGCTERVHAAGRRMVAAAPSDARLGRWTSTRSSWGDFGGAALSRRRMPSWRTARSVVESALGCGSGEKLRRVVPLNGLQPRSGGGPLRCGDPEDCVDFR